MSPCSFLEVATLMWMWSCCRPNVTLPTPNQWTNASCGKGTNGWIFLQSCELMAVSVGDVLTALLSLRAQWPPAVLSFGWCGVRPKSPDTNAPPDQVKNCTHLVLLLPPTPILTCVQICGLLPVLRIWNKSSCSAPEVGWMGLLKWKLNIQFETQMNLMANVLKIETYNLWVKIMVTWFRAMFLTGDIILKMYLCLLGSWAVVEFKVNQW